VFYKGEWITPTMRMENKKKPFNFDLLMPFGAKCDVAVMKENRVPPQSVNQTAGWTGYFVGYGATSGHEGCYRIFNPVTKGIRAVSYKFCTIHKDEFPWRNRPEWQARRIELPLEICPMRSVMLDSVELNKYAFDDSMYDEVTDRLQRMSPWGREDDVVEDLPHRAPRMEQSALPGLPSISAVSPSAPRPAEQDGGPQGGS
jgi:hypothetical protein